jgi:hypothetical protein
VSVLLHVGYLDEMRRCDPMDQFLDMQRRFAAVNQALRAADAPEYEEPSRIRGHGWGFKLYPGNGIAYLQRFAAYFCEDEVDEWPAPGDPATIKNPLDDETWKEACYMYDLLPFQHLILHHPTSGLWVPVDFDKVIVPDEKLGIGYQLGSSVRLKAECEELAKILRLPLDLDPEDEAVQEAKFNPGKSRTRWKKYGVESHNLLALYQACHKSIALGSAIYID